MLKFYCSMYLYQSLLEIVMHHIWFEQQMLVHCINIFLGFSSGLILHVSESCRITSARRKGAISSPIPGW